jgi:hypothetical protein
MRFAVSCFRDENKPCANASAARRLAGITLPRAEGLFQYRLT